MSREDVLLAPAWTLSIDAYRAARNASCPAIFEDASPFQVSRMNGAERRRYEATRAARYDKATAAYQAWQREIREAAARGEVTPSTPGISRDARTLLRADEEELDHALLDDVHERALVLSRLAPEEVVVGGIYYDVMSRGPVRVLKRHRVSVVVPCRYTKDGQAKVSISRLSRFPAHVLAGRASVGQSRSAQARARLTNEAVRAWHARIAEIRGAA